MVDRHSTVIGQDGPTTPLTAFAASTARDGRKKEVQRQQAEKGWTSRLIALDDGPITGASAGFGKVFTGKRRH